MLEEQIEKWLMVLMQLYPYLLGPYSWIFSQLVRHLKSERCVYGYLLVVVVEDMSVESGAVMKVFSTGYGSKRTFGSLFVVGFQVTSKDDLSENFLSQRLHSYGSHQYGFAGELLYDLSERRSCHWCHDDILYEAFRLPVHHPRTG